VKGVESISKQPEDKRQISVLVTISTTGKLSYPLFILKTKNVSANPNLIPGDCFIANSKKGFMTGEVFRNWINSFIAQEQITPKSPAILILDSHSSRMDYEALIYSQNHGLNIITFPGKATHLLQPLDVSLFKPFKQHFKEQYFNENKRFASLVEALVPIMKSLKAIFTQEKIKKAFTDVGLFPPSKETLVNLVQQQTHLKPLALSNETLTKIFTKPVVIEVPTTKQKFSSRVNISNQVLTGSKAIEEIKKKQEEKQKKEEEKKEKKRLKEENLLLTKN